MHADCSGSIFPLVTADTNKSRAHDRVAAAGSHRLKVLFLFSFQEKLLSQGLKRNFI